MEVNRTSPCHTESRRKSLLRLESGLGLGIGFGLGLGSGLGFGLARGLG